MRFSRARNATVTLLRNSNRKQLAIDPFELDPHGDRQSQWRTHIGIGQKQNGRRSFLDGKGESSGCGGPSCQATGASDGLKARVHPRDATEIDDDDRENSGESKAHRDTREQVTRRLNDEESIKRDATCLDPRTVAACYSGSRKAHQAGSAPKRWLSRWASAQADSAIESPDQDWPRRQARPPYREGNRHLENVLQRSFHRDCFAARHSGRTHRDAPRQVQKQFVARAPLHRIHSLNIISVVTGCQPSVGKTMSDHAGFSHIHLQFRIVTSPFDAGPIRSPTSPSFSPVDACRPFARVRFHKNYRCNFARHTTLPRIAIQLAPSIDRLHHHSLDPSIQRWVHAALTSLAQRLANHHRPNLDDALSNKDHL